MYKKGAFNDAIEKFNRVLSLHPKDKASKVYIERCEHLRETVNPEEWDGRLGDDVQIRKRPYY